MATKNTSKTSKNTSSKPETASSSKPSKGKPETASKPSKGKQKTRTFILADESKAAAGDVKRWEVNGIPVETKVAAGLQTKRDGSGKEDTIRYASVKIFGFNLSSVLRTLGRNDVSAAAARSIMENLKLTAVRPSQVSDKIGDGRNEVPGNYADLSKQQIKKLCELIDE